SLPARMTARPGTRSPRWRRSSIRWRISLRSSAAIALPSSIWADMLAPCRLPTLKYSTKWQWIVAWGLAGNKPRGIDVVPCAVYDSRTLCLTEDDPRLHGVWRSLVALLLWEQEVGGSNPSTPTKFPVAAGCWSSCRTLLSGTVKAGIRSRAAG